MSTSSDWALKVDHVAHCIWLASNMSLEAQVQRQNFQRPPRVVLQWNPKLSVYPHVQAWVLHKVETTKRGEVAHKTKPLSSFESLQRTCHQAICIMRIGSENIPLQTQLGLTASGSTLAAVQADCHIIRRAGQCRDGLVLLHTRLHLEAMQRYGHELLCRKICVEMLCP